MKRICVFCGSNSGTDPAYLQSADVVGKFLADEGIELVFGGGRLGLMGRVADSVLSAGGRVIGVIPKSLADKEVAHAGLTELHLVDSMHQRKSMMENLSDGFIALPGGFGTFEELCEIITWAQLGIHSKPCGILNIRGYYDSLIEIIDRAVRDQFIRPEHRRLVLTGERIQDLFGQMKNYDPPVIEKWIDERET